MSVAAHIRKLAEYVDQLETATLTDPLGGDVDIRSFRIRCTRVHGAGPGLHGDDTGQWRVFYSPQESEYPVKSEPAETLLDAVRLARELAARYDAPVPVTGAARTDAKDPLDPYLGDGPSGEYFSDERALVRLLTDEVLFANSRRYLDLEAHGGKEQPETIVLFVNCNDVFYWASADVERLPMAEVRTLYEMHLADPKWGSTKWCCRRRKLAPQVPVEKSMREAGAWDEEMDALSKPEPS